MFEAFPSLDFGSSGAWVIILQMLLYDIYKGKIHVQIDGYYGNETQMAIEAIQADNGLTVDGICGNAETWPCVIRIWWEGL